MFRGLFFSGLDCLFSGLGYLAVMGAQPRPEKDPAMLLFCAIFLTWLLLMDCFRVVYKSQTTAEERKEKREEVSQKIGAAIGTMLCLVQYVGGIVMVWALYLATK
jgi:hypothetical protein